MTSLNAGENMTLLPFAIAVLEQHSSLKPSFREPW
jgi:hypothetical protein